MLAAVTVVDSLVDLYFVPSSEAPWCHVLTQHRRVVTRSPCVPRVSFSRWCFLGACSLAASMRDQRSLNTHTHSFHCTIRFKTQGGSV